MTGSYKTLYMEAEGEIVEKKSRFIARIVPVETEEEALAFIEAQKKKYYDARHNCSAYIIGADKPLERASDDGEPSRTAGMPMLEVLQGYGLKNVCAVVTRYFGGTLLGTGGLVRAYQGAVREALETADIMEKTALTKLIITTDYSGLGRLQYVAAGEQAHIIDTEYTDRVVCTLLCDDRQMGILKKSMTEATSGQALFEEQGVFFCAETSEGFKVFERADLLQ